MIAQRESLSPEAAYASGKSAQARLISTPEFRRAQVVCLYSPVRNEVQTQDLFFAALASGKAVLFPAVENGRLVFRMVAQLQALKPGAYGIWEPSTVCEIRDVGDAGLIVVPGVVFDRFGRRIGYGKGYYDRALHGLEGTGRLAGLCYDFQLIDQISGEPHDVEMDFVVTDRELLYTSVS